MLRQRAKRRVRLCTIWTKQINVGVKDNGSSGVAKGEAIRAGRNGDLAKAVWEKNSDDEQEKHGRGLSIFENQSASIRNSCDEAR